MATKGNTIANKITGEKFTWIETVESSAGKKLSFNFELAPSGKLPVRHLHPEQVETFEIKSGELKLELNGNTSVLKAGDKIVIPKGIPHQWWNNSATNPTELLVTFEPALNTETFFEQFFGLCNDNKTDNGNPKFMQMMAMINKYQLYIAGPPVAIQKIMGVVLGSIAKVIGYKSFYKQYNEKFSQVVLA
jgi:quercetin dioxygenase-like cupin family protein